MRHASKVMEQTQSNSIRAKPASGRLRPSPKKQIGAAARPHRLKRQQCAVDTALFSDLGYRAQTIDYQADSATNRYAT